MNGIGVILFVFFTEHLYVMTGSIVESVVNRFGNVIMTGFSVGLWVGRRLFEQAAAERGLILVDTKYELGKDADGNIILVDEIHTPDSSRYWVKVRCGCSCRYCGRARGAGGGGVHS